MERIVVSKHEIVMVTSYTDLFPSEGNKSYLSINYYTILNVTITPYGSLLKIRV